MVRHETALTYKGTSEGIAKLIDGMYAYGEDINLYRVFPDIRDGFKISQRRVAYAILSTNEFWKNEITKSLRLVGEALKSHPHGDAAVYDVISRMTTNSKYQALALLEGSGSWGSKISGEKAAASRYTDIGVSPFLKNYRHELLDGVEYVNGELMDGRQEPAYLSLPFPNVFANESAGIGFGLASYVPSYNVGELIDLTVKLIKEGSLKPTDIIHPDFTTGGLLVADNAVASKVMLKGTATYRTRAKVGIEGSIIQVFEVPAGKTLNTIKSKLSSIIKEDSVPDIKSFQDGQGYNPDGGEKGLLNIYCKRGTAEKVLHELYARSVLENYYAVNMLVNKGDKILMGGLHKLLGEWVSFRKEHLKNKYISQIDGFSDELALLEVFISLVNDIPNKKEYLRLLTETGRSEADSFLASLYPGVSKETVVWVRGRTAESFRDGSKYKARYDSIHATIEEFKNNLKDLDGAVIRELIDFKQRFNQPRKTELTTQAYSFKKIKAQGGTAKKPKLVDDSKAYFTFTKSGFVHKAKGRVSLSEDDVLVSIEAPANSVFQAFDNSGRLFRIFGEELPYSDKDGAGVYLYKYAGLPVEEGQGKEVLYACLQDGGARTILLHSGNIVVFDTNFHATNQKIRYKNRAVNVAVSTEGIAKVFEPGTLPRYLMVVDLHESGSKEVNRIGLLDTSTLRTAKTSNTKIRAFNQRMKQIVGYVDVPENFYKGNVWLADELLRGLFISGKLLRVAGYNEVYDAMVPEFEFMERIEAVSAK